MIAGRRRARIGRWSQIRVTRLDSRCVFDTGILIAILRGDSPSAIS